MVSRGIATMTLDTGRRPKWLLERKIEIRRELKIFWRIYINSIDY